MLTTLINITIFFTCYEVININILVSNIIAWFLSILFAYITNKKWVFNSPSRGIKKILEEIFYFCLGRIGTGILDTLIIYIFVDILSFNSLVIKISSNIIVVVLNYVISKLLVFKKGNN